MTDKFGIHDNARETYTCHILNSILGLYFHNSTTTEKSDEIIQRYFLTFRAYQFYLFLKEG